MADERVPNGLAAEIEEHNRAEAKRMRVHTLQAAKDGQPIVTCPYCGHQGPTEGMGWEDVSWNLFWMGVALGAGLLFGIIAGAVVFVVFLLVRACPKRFCRNCKLALGA